VSRMPLFDNYIRINVKDLVDKISIALILSGVFLILMSMIMIFLNCFKVNTYEAVFYFMAYIYTSSLGFIFILAGFQASLYKYVINENRIVKAVQSMNDDERIVLHILENNGGEVTQAEIVCKTGFSPAKVSRLIKNLQKMGIVICKRNGRVKVVALSREYLIYKRSNRWSKQIIGKVIEVT